MICYESTLKKAKQLKKNIGHCMEYIDWCIRLSSTPYRIP